MRGGRLQYELMAGIFAFSTVTGEASELAWTGRVVVVSTFL